MHIITLNPVYCIPISHLEVSAGYTKGDIDSLGLKIAIAEIAKIDKEVNIEFTGTDNNAIKITLRNSDVHYSADYELRPRLMEKQALRERLESGFAQIGLGAQQAPVDLTGKCRWVPASIRHETAENNASRSLFFVYGGVNIQPRLNVLRERVGANGERLRFGGAQNPATRFSAAQLQGGQAKVIPQGNRKEMVRVQRTMHEALSNAKVKEAPRTKQPAEALRRDEKGKQKETTTARTQQGGVARPAQPPVPPGGKNGSFLKEGLHHLNPKDIRFTQPTISPNFTRGKPVDKGSKIKDKGKIKVKGQDDDNGLTILVKELRSGAVSPYDIPPIRVVQDKNGVLFSIDNRRLACYNGAGIDKIPVQIVSAKKPEIAGILIDRKDPIRGQGQYVVVVKNKKRKAELDKLYKNGMIKGIHRGQK